MTRPQIEHGACRPDRDARVDRAWLASWLGLPVLGVANGILRERAYRERLGNLRAHQVSTAFLIAAMAAYASTIQRGWPIPRRSEAIVIGGAWAALTVGFEFGFGHFVAGTPWSDLLRDYDVRRGRLWVLVPVAAAALPSVARALDPRARM